MSASLNITAATVDPALLDLPWNLPLEIWPEETIAALPKESRATSCASCT